MKPQLSNLIFWIGAILLVVLVTLFYRPAAAKTGSLLVWQDGEIYVLDIDSLARKPVGPAEAGARINPSPGCLGLIKAPCWVAAAEKLYPVGGGGEAEKMALLEGVGQDSALSWSPDGLHLAYTTLPAGSNQTELRLYNVATGETKKIASDVDPALAVAWSRGCVAGLAAAACQLGYRAIRPDVAGDQSWPHLVVPAWASELRPEIRLAKNKAQSQLVTLTPLTGAQQVWPVPGGPIFELSWAADNTLLYSQPQHYFRRVQDYSPAYQISPGSQLANMSLDGRYTVYYEPFTQKECQAERPKGGCWYLGVWLAGGEPQQVKRQLIYSVELTQAGEGMLITDPFWSPGGEAFAFFREGKLIYYDLDRREGTIWYQSLRGRLASAPVFSPNAEAIAFVYQSDQGSRQYHLLVLNPQFKPLEHLIEAQEGLRVLAWLPQQIN
jgi:hypothetical protein